MTDSNRFLPVTFIAWLTIRTGKKPFASEMVEWIWEIGSQVTQSQHEEIMRRHSTFAGWFSQEFWASNAIVVLPVDDVEPRHRDQYPGTPVWFS